MIVRIAAIVSGVLLVCLLGVALAVFVYLARINADLPDYTTLKNYEPPVTTRIHAGDGTLIREYARETRLFVPIEVVPENVVQAFLSAEDKNFYSHPGVDYMGIMRASVANVFNYLNNRRLEGASTITQQVAKNFLLTNEVKFERKIREALIAFKIEKAFTKDEILELYLNEIYLGWRAYGVAAAALNYFDKSLDELTVAEAAYLAAMPKAPNNYRPDRERSRDRGIARRNWVVGQMLRNDFISEEDAELAIAEPLLVHERPTGATEVEYEYFAEEVRREVGDIFGEKSLYDGGLSVRTTLETDYQRMALDALRTGLVNYDRRHGWRGAHTTIEMGEGWRDRLEEVEFPGDLEPWLTAAVTEVDDEAGIAKVAVKSSDLEGEIPLADLDWARTHLDDFALGDPVTKPSQVLAPGDVIFVAAVDEEGNELEDPAGAAHFSLRQVPKANGGIVVMDPHSGRVLAMIGGFSFYASEYNRAVQANRQPGSSFKPFVYAAALDSGFTPADLILDAPIVVEQAEGEPLWKPKNYSDRFYGPSTLRLGIEKSRNLMTVRLAQEIGMERVSEYAKRFGIDPNMPPYLAMALGAGETTLMRMVTAYSMLVNGGKSIEPSLIDRVQDRFGKTIYRHDTRVCENCMNIAWENQGEPVLPDGREQIVDGATAYQIVSLLEGVVNRGTGRSIAEIGKPLAGKTGTTNDSFDAWFVGFSPDLAVGVYVGFDAPSSLGDRETGGRVAAPIFKAFMKSAIGEKPAVPFRIPPGIRLVRVDLRTGLPASDATAVPVILEAFKPGTEPRKGPRAVLGAGASTGGFDAEGSRTVGGGTGGLY